MMMVKLWMVPDVLLLEHFYKALLKVEMAKAASLCGLAEMVEEIMTIATVTGIRILRGHYP